MDFEVVGSITDVEIIAVNTSIRDLPRLVRVYGRGPWRKLKGNARVRFLDGTESDAEVHWYAAHRIGKREMKIKRLLGE